MTFLAVPVIALEGTGPHRRAQAVRADLPRALGRAGDRPGVDRLRRRDRRVVPAAILVAVGVLIGGAVAIGVFVGLAVVIVIVAGIISTALSQIFAVALYRFATGSGTTGAFTEAELAHSIVPRKARPGQI